MNEIIVSILASIGGGAVSGLLTVAAMKTDISWLKELVRDHNERIKNLEGCAR